MKIRHALLAAVAAAGFAMPAQSAVGFADIVLDYFDSGAGPMAGPYGGLGGILGAFPVAVPTSVVLGSDVAGSETFLSLPTGSYVTVGFTDESVVDGIGNDIFIQEIGGSGESAQVYVSADLITYIFLGIAIDNGSTAFDLNSIGFASAVQGIRIVGLDNGGGSPGFDVVNIQVLPGSIGAPVPEPSTWAMMLLGFGAMGGMIRRRKARRLAIA